MDSARSTNIIRLMDDLGRIIIPKPVRKQLGFNEGDKFEIFTTKDGNIVLVKVIEKKPMEIGYPEHIVKILRQRKGIDENDTKLDNELMTLSPNEVLEEVLHWEGIYGYETTIRTWIRDIYGVNLAE